MRGCLVGEARFCLLLIEPRTFQILTLPKFNIEMNFVSICLIMGPGPFFDQVGLFSKQVRLFSNQVGLFSRFGAFCPSQMSAQIGFFFRQGTGTLGDELARLI